MTTPWTYAPELLTDLYELTMAASYLQEGMTEEATFSLFIRSYPANRAYFVSAGLEHLVETVTQLSFRDSSLRYLASLEKFDEKFLNYLQGFRFSGTIRAIPEGRIFFVQEPILEVTAPLIEGQILETMILNTIQLETLIASKAARCVHAARGRDLVDFSLRRTHGMDAGLKAARGSYIVGFLGTSNLMAGKRYGIPVFGTMAHSYVTSFESEMDAFAAYSRAFPQNTVLLIDTYDTLSGAHKAVELARQMRAEGKELAGVRLDSGDMAQLSKKVREILVGGGFPQVKILASGNLDEFKVEELVRSGAEIDVFAVGTRMGVSADAPYFDIAYKLVEYKGKPVLKLSTGKRTWVGKKQVYRFYDEKGEMKEDRVSLAWEECPGAEPLLEKVVEGGRPARPPETLTTIRERFMQEWDALPLVVRDLRPRLHYPVSLSAELEDLQERMALEASRREIRPGPVCR
ncbi:MAG: nicotinate phosphoribosyltransferase [Syntrophobacteraceae bacterium]|nr:nicotinate phosphoribosyltransferase [Syntrophobacteraceae bacterium]